MRKLGRIFFSRYAICALIIAAEIALFIALQMLMESFAVLISFSTLISAIAIIHLINRNVNPEYKSSWAVVILFLPYVGVSFYALFFRRRMTRREIRLGEKISRLMKSPPGCEQNIRELQEEDPLASGKARALLGDDVNAELFRATRSRYFASGEEYFKSLTAALLSAEKSIYLEYFIIEEGVMWNTVHKILTEKAQEGLDVRVMYDDIGCMKTLPGKYYKRLISEGIDCRIFAKVTPKVTTVHNNRDHRKIAVIDNKIAYTGGINLADEYINEKDRLGHWKDGGVMVEGAAAFGFAKQFLSLWAYNSRRAEEAVLPLSQYSAVRGEGDGGYYIPFGAGPMPLYDSSAKNAFLNIINQACSYVYITTPYLIIDFDLTEALCCAAERGVDVRIITPSRADKRIIKVMTKSSYPYLLKSGVRIFEYSPGFIHEKLLVCDDLYAVIGSINFDYRSLVHHFEAGLWIYKSPTVKDAKDGFLKTEELSRERDVKTARLNPIEWIVRILVKLFAPLL